MTVENELDRIREAEERSCVTFWVVIWRGIKKNKNLGVVHALTEIGAGHPPPPLPKYKSEVLFLASIFSVLNL